MKFKDVELFMNDLNGLVAEIVEERDRILEEKIWCDTSANWKKNNSDKEAQLRLLEHLTMKYNLFNYYNEG